MASEPVAAPVAAPVDAPVAEPVQEQHKFKILGKAPNQWVILETLWEFFRIKSIKTVFFSVGTDESPLVDLEIAETLGCPLHIWDVNESALASWKDVHTILSKKPLDTPSKFCEDIENKWVLPRNLYIHPVLPSANTGSIQKGEKNYPTQSLDLCVKEACLSMKLNEQRIDILKVSIENECEFLYTLMNSLYRPGILLIKWSAMPDANFHTTLCAGHLQNCGYRLLETLDNKFLYLYTENNMYEICSWEDKHHINPMVHEILKDQ